MRKTLNDKLSSGSLNSIDTDAWSKNHVMMHPIRTATNENSFTIIGKTCLSRGLLETEVIFFGKTEDVTFAEVI